MTRSVEGRGAPPSVDRPSLGARLRHNVVGAGAWAMSFLRYSRTGLVGVVIVAVFAIMAVFAPLIAPNSPTKVFPDYILSPPSSMFPFGTDINGMDVLSRVIHGARIDLAIAGAAVIISLAIGLVLGLVSGYVGGWFDLILLRTMDVLQAIPVLILALAVVAASGQSLAIVVLVIAFVDIPIYTRLVRAQTLSIRESAYVESARAVGNPPARLLAKHILPNAFPPVIIQTSVRFAWAIKITAGLAFVGVGIQVPQPEWGAMIKVGAGQIISGVWWPSVFPGLAILLFAFGLNLLADGLQDYLDPENRS